MGREPGYDINRKDLAIQAVLFMWNHDLEPKLEECDKRLYNDRYLLEILAMCETHEIFRRFVENTGMLSKFDFSNPFCFFGGMIIGQLELFLWGCHSRRYRDEVFKSLKYVFTKLNNYEKVEIFWKFLTICERSSEVDQYKIKIYNFLVEQQLDFNVSIFQLDNEGNLYTADIMRNKVNVYRSRATPVQPTQELKDTELKDDVGERSVQ